MWILGRWVEGGRRGAVVVVVVDVGSGKEVVGGGRRGERAGEDLGKRRERR